MSKISQAYAAQQAFQAQYQPYVPPSPVVPAVVAVAVAPSTAAPVAQPDLRSLTSLLTLLQSNADLLAAGQTPAPGIYLMSCNDNVFVRWWCTLMWLCSHIYFCSLYHAVAAASTALLAQANAFYQQTQLAAKQPAAVTPIVLASPMPTHVNMQASQQMAEYTTHQVNSMRVVYAPCCVSSNSHIAVSTFTILQQPQQQQSPAPGTSAYYAPVKPTAVPVSLQTPLQLAQFAIAQTKQFATPSPYAEQQQYGAAQNAQTAQPQMTYTDAQQVRFCQSILMCAYVCFYLFYCSSMRCLLFISGIFRRPAVDVCRCPGATSHRTRPVFQCILNAATRSATVHGSANGAVLSTNGTICPTAIGNWTAVRAGAKFFKWPVPVFSRYSNHVPESGLCTAVASLATDHARVML